MLRKQNNHFNKSTKDLNCDLNKHSSFSNKIDSNTYLLIGAPNVGKSTFFNKASAGTAEVSNFDRLTVAPNYAHIRKDKTKTIIDLPGIYNLSHPVDEEITVANFLVTQKFSKIINIIGAQSIQRDLLLSIQSIETGLMSTLIINMVDEVNIKKLDINKLSAGLNNVKVILTQANKNKGIEDAVNSITNDFPVSSNILEYDKITESCISQISNFLPETKLSKRFISLMVLENNQEIISNLKQKIGLQYCEIQKILDKYKNIDFIEVLRAQRIKYVNNLLNKCFVSNNKKTTFFYKGQKKNRKFDHVFLNGWIGIPLIILLLLVIYYLSFGTYAGGTLQKLFYEDFLTNIVNRKWLNSLFNLIFHPELGTARQWAVELFIEGIFNGFFVVLSFCIPIFILFTLINLIQQIGVMSRISILLDRALNRFGLSGRSVVNLLTGFGCNVTSIMMTRSTNSKKEHIISLVVAPFISCSSRTIVLSTICTMIFGFSLGWMYVAFLLFMSGIIALTIGFTFSKTMFRKSKSFFLVEVVDWRKPDFFVIFKSVGLQIKSFIIKAATFILIANFIIWFFTHIGPGGLLLNDKIDVSLFGYAAKDGLNYLMYPFGGSSSMGYVGNNDGWKMTLSLITAFPAKEIALGNITTLFGSQTSFQLFVSANMPIAISYMTIFLLYIPCAATISTMCKEGGWKLVGTHLAISLSVSYVLGIISYWIAFGIVMTH